MLNVVAQIFTKILKDEAFFNATYFHPSLTFAGEGKSGALEGSTRFTSSLTPLVP